MFVFFVLVSVFNLVLPNRSDKRLSWDISTSGIDWHFVKGLGMCLWWMPGCGFFAVSLMLELLSENELRSFLFSFGKLSDEWVLFCKFTSDAT